MVANNRATISSSWFAAAQATASPASSLAPWRKSNSTSGKLRCLAASTKGDDKPVELPGRPETPEAAVISADVGDNGDVIGVTAVVGVD